MPDVPEDATPSPAEPSSSKRRRRRRRRHRGAASMRGLEKMMLGLEQGRGAEALLTTMGMAPVFATAESMITASQAQGQMMLGAVANQQRLNSLALIATGGCVMQMLRLGERMIDEDDDDGGMEDLLRRFAGKP